MLNPWELTNVLSQLVLPPGGLIVLGLIGLALARAHGKTGARVSLLALSCLYLLSAPVVSRSLLRTLEQAYDDPAKDPTPGAIVVLGGGSYAQAPEFGGDTVSAETLERLRYAAHLQRRTGKPVLVSGGNPTGLAKSEGEQMKAALADFNVPTAWVDGGSDNTYASARLSKALLERSGIGVVYLVTHAWHMRRAQFAFEQAGLRVVPAPTGFKPQRAVRPLAFVPNTAALTDSYRFFHEVVGIAWYRLKFALGN